MLRDFPVAVIVVLLQLVQASEFVQERLLEVSFTRSSSMSVAARFWPTSILSDALRIVYQNMLLESNDEILCSSERVWRLLLQVILPI